MKKAKNANTCDFELAIRNMPARGYRKAHNRYEAFASVHSKTVFLGSFKDKCSAKEVVIKHRISRFVDGCKRLGLNPNDGVVYNERYIVFPTGYILNLHGEEIIGAINADGYREVFVNKKTRRLHRIIAEVFIPNEHNLPQINHKNGIKTDNRVENLEWCTASENMLHAYRTGLEKRRCGEEHHKHILTNNDIRYIRAKYIKKDKQFGAIPLGKRFGVDRTTILSVVKGKTWREVD